jgi:hypothetical protein
VITVLVDHDIEGQAATLWRTLAAEGWLDLVPLRLLTFADVGLALDSSDRMVWRSAQAHGMLLLTNNRSMDEEDSLEQTLREENTPQSPPVLTVGSAARLEDQDYRERCALRILEIVLYLERYLGARRIFIP